MQLTDGFSVPRRSLDVEDYIDILRRHRGWIFGPFLLTLVASVVGVYLWPDSYVSQATVKVQPQQVPENMVQSAVNQAMTDRIGSMSQTILSRATLTTIINNFGLYPRERKSMPIEDVIEEMKKRIEILPVSNVGGPGRQVPAFAVQYSYENRFLAQKVVQDLVTRFIDENIRSRGNATFLTAQFMKDEADQAKKKLDDVESKLTEFRIQNNGRLPDQAESNSRQLQSLEASSTYLANSISRATQEKLQMEGGLNILKNELAELGKQPQQAVVQKRNEKLEEADKEIEAWQNQLTVLRQRFKDTYPDVQSAIQRLNAAQQKRESILKEEAENKKEGPPPAQPVNPQAQKDVRDLNASILRTQSQIEGKDLEIQEYAKQLKDVNDHIKLYQGRLEIVPLGEKQYGELLREREMAKEGYEDLQGKVSKAEIAKEMEDRKQGEILEQLDPASLPATPTEPRRPMVISVGAGIGLLLGLVIAGMREVKDSSLKNLKDVRAYTQMTILGSIPLLENDLVVRRRRRLAWLGWTTACLAAAIVISGSIVYYNVTRG
jgi:polysaccharide chain length determinant protein (PEP-CTERM system associated)